MAPERPVRTVWIVVGLIFGIFLVLAGPVLLFWNAVNAHPWNEGNLTAEFQSIRYDAGGLVFRYVVHNLTRQAAQFEPTLTEVHTVQSKDRPLVGYPNVLLPFSVPARGSHVVEVRLELPGLAQPSAGLPAVPSTPGAAVSPTPSVAAAGTAVDFVLQDALSDLNGFELVDDTNGLRLVLPRAW